jgi:cytochrome b561
MAPSPGLHAIFKTAHDFGAAVLVWGLALHVAGVMKHMFIDRDGLFDRIMVPPPKGDAPAAPAASPEKAS